MIDEQPPITPYRARSERLTLRELWAMAPRRLGFFAALFGNWLICGGLMLLIGGNAIGTMPSRQGYVVVSHGHVTRVTEHIWLLSLYYPSATLLITPLGVVLVIATLIRGLFDGKPPFARVLLVFSLWYVPWSYSILADTIRSALDYAHADGAWRVICWLLIAGAILVFPVLIVADRRARQRAEKLAMLKGDCLL